ncbi:DNA (cytosine-5-)-methyltransferase [Spirulina sp. CS-785/01]|uniref:DNA cytosine methyltransferase n=1 Tax=Spirulina sp. CS-785/01 TaxID=3021716 RepID=UPI00233149C0|nr:DNA (cytosine-5-)-methyltransferase [Spirulina sp. CS-785/01]MDB9313289.1 DNA (cytosine-5-)-methyltransferase [Spirulina sp. CS-785/01]
MKATALKLEKTPYLDLLNQELQPTSNEQSPLVIDLFAGCGGFSLGFEAAGFRTIGYEMDTDACKTYQQNLQGKCQQVTLTRHPNLPNNPEVIIASPPCQPFSKGGYQLGENDSRNGFPIFLDAVQQYRPSVAIFENVRGMLYRNRIYFNQLVTQLTELGYWVDWELLKASDYGVPQKRQRLFCVAYQGTWQWHSKLYNFNPYTVGEALGNLAVSIPPNAKFLTPSQDRYIAKYEAASQCINPRDLYLDKPARTVTCRNLSAATGDMLRIRLPDGRRRRLIVQEGARLQSFPDWFKFSGTEDSQFQQIGNAVPPLLAKSIALAVKKCLKTDNKTNQNKPQQYNQLDLNLKFHCPIQT